MNMARLQTNIPLELKTKPNWVLHHRKIPMMALDVGPASSADKRTWCAYKEAVKMANIRKPDGIGFMFEPPYIGIDLDDCVENGIINDYASNIIKKCDSYTEFSPSGTGVHIIIKGVLPQAYKSPTLEIYQTGRYFTMTGNRISNHSLIREIKDLSFLYPQGSNIVRTTLAEKIQAVQEGNRNNSLASLAGFYRRKGLEPQEIFDTLLPKAKEVNFDEKELWTICRSIGRYQPAINPVNGSSIEDFLKYTEKVEWIVPDLIAKGSIIFVAGLPETMKTWMLIDLAIECAKEKDGLWLGRFPVNHAKVLLIDQERFKGETQRRLKAVICAKSIEMPTISQELFIRCGTTTRLDLQNSYEAFKREIADIKPDLIIIDSFATFHTKEENNRKDIQEVLERVKELRNEFGCTFIFIDHEGKGVFTDNENGKDPSAFRMVGSIAKPAAAETIFTVRKQDSNTSMVYHTKSTLASTIAPFMVKVEDLTLDKSKIRVYTI